MRGEGRDGNKPVLFWEQPRKRFRSEFEVRKFYGGMWSSDGNLEIAMGCM
jgi:hypothetical protein